jgi:hypothetical protein
MFINLVARCCFSLISDATDRSGVNTVTIVALVLLLIILSWSFESFAANRWFEEGLLYVALNTGSLFSY